ncbi:hypothetical protein LZL87_013748 [Fusarium oxysporum]|nr:hypothetical protein LZL87_013748 [Fusarium oxysporum]
MEFSTVPWSDLDFIRELWPAIAVRHKTKQCKRFLAEFGIASVDGVDAKGGSKSDNNSDNKFDATGFLHDTSLAYYENFDGFTYIVCKPLFKEASFGHWVQMEVKITESETGDSEDTKYYPVGEVWIGHERKEKPENPYKLSNHFSSPRTSESTPSYNSSTSITGLNPNSRQTITKPLKGVMYEFDIASAPALPYPQHWENGQRYSVVTNTVFEELERNGVVLREACHFVPIEVFHLQKEYEWIPPNEIIWYIRGTRCVTSMINDTGTPEILGYNKGKDYEMWVAFDSIDYDRDADLGGFPTKIIDQYGYATVIAAPKQPPSALH